MKSSFIAHNSISLLFYMLFYNLMDDPEKVFGETESAVLIRQIFIRLCSFLLP